MFYHWITALAIMAFSGVSNGQAVTFLKDIAAVPEVECNPDAIVVRLNTTGLASKIFIRGHHDDTNCSFQQTNTARFFLQDCGIVRQRQLKPKGLAVTSTFVVQLHPFFITKLDRAYKVRCFYLEADRTITSSMEVSTLSASPIEQQPPLPQCHYQLRMDTPDGEEVRYARIGDRVWHIWECDSSDTYGILVHSCNVHDGKGNQIQIIDETGCAVDEFIIQTPMYNDTYNVAQQETMVFKFADVLVVQFHCQIKLCFRSNGGCENITPPSCEGRHNRTLQLVHSDSPFNETLDESVEGVNLNGEHEMGEIAKAEGMVPAVEATAETAVEEHAASGDGVVSGAEELNNDTRSRRNVYSETWFTDSPYAKVPAGLEADVSQEILVLDVGDAAAELKEDKIPMQMSLMDSEQKKKKRATNFCVTSGILAACISAFIFVVMLLALTVFLLFVRKNHVRMSFNNDFPKRHAYKL